MAGRGPVPKSQQQRRRQNVPERGEWMDLEPLEDPVLPLLPDDQEWHPRTQALWSAWREDPATGMYGPAEVAAAVELAYLTDDSVSGGRGVKPSELRLRMDGLGLTLKGKRDLRVRVVGEVAESDAPAKPAEVRSLRAV